MRHKGKPQSSAQHKTGFSLRSAGIAETIAELPSDTFISASMSVNQAAEAPHLVVDRVKFGEDDAIDCAQAFVLRVGQVSQALFGDEESETEVPIDGHWMGGYTGHIGRRSSLGVHG